MSRRPRLTRLEDWPARLEAAIRAAYGRPHAWGEHDCCLFAADLVDAQCGSAIARRYRGRYRTARGARGQLKRRGGLEALVAPIGPEIAPAFAGRGDVVELAPDPEIAETTALEGAGITLGICVGERVAALAPGGLALVPRAAIVRAWRTGGHRAGG